MQYAKTDTHPGAEERDIDRVRQFFEEPLSSAWIDLLREHDGVTMWADPKEIQLLSTSEVLSYYECFHLDEYMSDAIPFAMDGGGNMLVFRVGRDQVFVVSTGDLGWDAARSVSDSFTQFLDDPRRPDEYLHG